MTLISIAAMGSQFCFPLLFTFLLLIFMILKTWKNSKAKNFTHENLPPGPPKLPIIGNLHQIFGSLPHHCLTDLAKKHGPLMHLKLGQFSTVVISSPEIAKEFMKTHDPIFASRPSYLVPRIMAYGASNIVFSPYGGYWRQLRKICTMELLSSKRVQSFRGIREEEVKNLVADISSNIGSTINLSKKVFEMTYGITSRTVLGKKAEDQEVFISIMMELVKLTAVFSAADLFPSLEAVSVLRFKLEKFRKQIDRILEKIIAEHKSRIGKERNGQNRETEDLVDVLLKLQEADELEFPLSDDNIKAVILDIFTAGTETSATAVEWVMSEMLKNPMVIQKAQVEVRQVFGKQGYVDETAIHELHFLKLVIKETLRLHPSVPLIPRECSQGCEINGYHIPVKTRVLVNTWAIGRDPKYWKEPERFRPERFLDNPLDFKGMNFEYIPFGSGRRLCPGIYFGMANVELPLAQLLYHFDWKLPGAMKHEDLDMAEARGATLRRGDLMVVPMPHHSKAAP